MSGRSLDHTVHAFEFIEELDRLASPQAIIDAMERCFAQYGFENFIMTGLPHPEQRIESLVLLKKWPLGWYERYTRNSFDRHDPVIRLCRQTVQPFEWSEARYDPETNPRGKEIMQGAADFGMRQGYCLPIHGLNGFEACLSMSGPDLDLTPQTKPAIHLMAMYAFERARLVMSPSPRPNPRPPRAGGVALGSPGEIGCRYRGDPWRDGTDDYGSHRQRLLQTERRQQDPCGRQGPSASAHRDLTQKHL